MYPLMCYFLHWYKLMLLYTHSDKIILLYTLLNNFMWISLVLDTLILLYTFLDDSCHLIHLWISSCSFLDNLTLFYTTLHKLMPLYIQMYTLRSMLTNVMSFILLNRLMFIYPPLEKDNLILYTVGLARLFWSPLSTHVALMGTLMFFYLLVDKLLLFYTLLDDLTSIWLPLG